MVRTISLSLLDARGSLVTNQIQSLFRVPSFTEPKIGALTLSPTVANKANSASCQSALIERFHRSYTLHTSTQFTHLPWIPSSLPPCQTQSHLSLSLLAQNAPNTKQTHEIHSLPVLIPSITHNVPSRRRSPMRGSSMRSSSRRRLTTKRSWASLLRSIMRGL